MSRMADVQLCECGCGSPAPVYTKSNRRLGIVIGRPHRFIANHHCRKRVIAGPYRLARTEDGKRTTLHRVRAAKSLGKPLPRGAVVHHADGTTDDTAPLVICQNQDYHLQLHKRMRVVAAGGNPWTDKICHTCRLVKHKDQFGRNTYAGDGHAADCKECAADWQRRYRLDRSA